MIRPDPDFPASFAQARERFLAAQDAFDPLDPPPPPDPRIATGRWSSLAASELERRDDLRRVARLVDVGRRQGRGPHA